ncbi:MAG: DUF4465 domain-containing protein [Bacteroidota bacterium]
MKKTTTKLAMVLFLATLLNSKAQTVSFDTFTLSPNSYYQDNSSNDFTSNGATFQYGWNTAFGGYWESGSAYTNLNDTIDGTYTNLYGAITGIAFSGNNYATVQSGAKITFNNNTTAVSGFYITNTTYAWKEIKKGGFGRRFGDTTGTGSGNIIPQGEYPDWFKVNVRGYRGGNMINDSVQFYLADYRAPGILNDYVVKNWQFFNCISLGQVDSIKFEMKSSDNNAFGIKTPTFFSMDNFTTVSTVGIHELESISAISLFPNPATQNIFLSYESNSSQILTITVFDISGKEIQYNRSQTSAGKFQKELNLQEFEAGVYFIEIADGTTSKKIKFIKL